MPLFFGGGSGGSGGDVSQLRGAGGAALVGVGVTGDTNNRRELRSDGSIWGGPGNSLVVRQVLITPAGSTYVGNAAGNAETSPESNNNVGVGRNALAANTTGTGSVAVGTRALTANTTGVSSVGAGVNALAANTTGNSNVGVGNNTLEFNTTGSNNVAVGRNALAAPGGISGNGTTTAQRQTALGAETGQSSAVQRNDITVVGYRALVDGDNATALGSGASAGASGAVAIGRDSGGTSASTTTTNEFMLGTASHIVRVLGSLRVAPVLTASLPAGSASEDGRILIENAGGSNRNIIIYDGGLRFRILGGVAF